MYQLNIPKAMNERKTTITRGRIDGAVHMSKGRIGDFANLASQMIKATKWRMATIKRTYS